MHFATDMGWIMGPWTVVGVGALGGTIVFAEGAPDWPAPDRLWRTVEQERVTSLGLSPTLDARAAPARRPDERPLVAAHVRDDRRAVEPRAVPLALRERRRLARAGHQLHRRHRGRRVLPLADADRRRSRRARSAARRSGWRWTSSTTTARRSSAPARSASSSAAQPFPGHDARLLARPGEVHRDVLVAAPRRLGARRLGVGRRGRLLVPARPLRRHDEHRRQAHRPGRARVGGGRSPGGARGGGDRRAARGEGRDGVDLLLPAARRRGDARPRSRRTSPTSSARRSSRTACSSSTRCRRRARRRSCAAR